MDAIARLVTGYHRFRSGYYVAHRKALTALAHRGQSPAICIVSCTDSQVDPSLILDCKPGELYVIRNIANLVPPIEAEGLYHGTTAALEFAVCGLEVAHIIVLGHARCAGIQALLAGVTTHHPRGGFVAAWMSIAHSARAQVLRQANLATPEGRAGACEQAAIKLSLQNLRTFPWVSDRIDRGALRLHGWYYDPGHGELMCLDPSNGHFASVTAP